MSKGLKSPGAIVKTNVRLQKGVKGKIADKLKEQGLSIKERSAWVTRAVESLLTLSDFEEIVVNEFLAGESEGFPYTTREGVIRDIDTAAERASESMGTQVDRSSIIRTAITQALIWEGSVLFDPADFDGMDEDDNNE